MIIVSSQKFRDEDIVNEKIEQLKADGVTFVIIPVVNTFMDDMYIVVDKHHTMTAAYKLGLEIRFEEVEDELSYYADIENKNSDGIFEAHYMDSPYYYIDSDCENIIGSDVF